MTDKRENILEEANRITSTDRRQAYGPASLEFERVAAMWSSLLEKKLVAPITAEEMALCMILLKIVRRSYKQGRDSLVDIAGYARTIEMLTDEENQTIWEKQEELAVMPLTDIIQKDMDKQMVALKEKVGQDLYGKCPTCKRCLCSSCDSWHKETHDKPFAASPEELEEGKKRMEEAVERAQSQPKMEYREPHDVGAWTGVTRLVGPNFRSITDEIELKEVTQAYFAGHPVKKEPIPTGFDPKPIGSEAKPTGLIVKPMGFDLVNTPTSTPNPHFGSIEHKNLINFDHKPPEIDEKQRAEAFIQGSQDPYEEAMGHIIERLGEPWEHFDND